MISATHSLHQRNVALVVRAVHEKPFGRLPDVSAFATDDRQAEEWLTRWRTVAAAATVQAAVAAALLQHCLVRVATDALSRRPVGSEVYAGAALAESKTELGTAEAIIAAINRRCD